MSDLYIKPSIAALLCVAVLYLLEGKSLLSKLNVKGKQLIFGVIFGALAIIGAERGIPMNVAQVDCRNIAVLIAGLLFGAYAGIIVGMNGVRCKARKPQLECGDQPCRFVKDDADAFVGNAPQCNDITMAAPKNTGTPPASSIRIENAAISDIPAVTEFVEAELEKLDCPMKSTVQINIAIDELLSNIVKYGYAKQPGPVTVTVIAKDDPHGVCIRFEDEAIPYNPLDKEDPDISLSAEERGIGGLGIFLVKKTMDDIKYSYENGKNILLITKYF